MVSAVSSGNNKTVKLTYILIKALHDTHTVLTAELFSRYAVNAVNTNNFYVTVPIILPDISEKRVCMGIFTSQYSNLIHKTASPFLSVHFLAFIS